MPLTGRSIAFITDELFLPPRNGSQQTYASVTRDYAEKGWQVFCISFYRDPKLANSEAVQSAYQATFRDFLLLPGWNRGGTFLGRLGQAIRELDRAVTGNTLATHPFLAANGAAEAARITAWLRERDVRTFYVHKVHGLQLAGRVLPNFSGAEVILDLHDDFVLRSQNYDAVHRSVFGALPLSAVLHKHGPAWVRHQFSRTNATRSRRVESALLARCTRILVGAEEEMETYAANPQLSGKVVHWPVTYDPPRERGAGAVRTEHDAGFIGSEDVMNLDALIHFRDAILPRLRERVPGFRFLVAGRVANKAGPLLRGVAGLTLWPRLDRIEDFYGAIKVSVVPIRYGTGVSIKVLEALKYGKPIVSTRAGVRGVTPEQLRGVAVVDDPDDFADTVAAEVRRQDSKGTGP